LTQVLVVVLGQPCAVLYEATRPNAPLANSPALTLLHVPYEVHAVSDMAGLPAFRLAWIFVDELALESHILRACHERLCLAAPVTIAIYHARDKLEQQTPCPSFPGGVILQPYTEATFPLVQTLITGFIAKNTANASQWQHQAPPSINGVGKHVGRGGG